VNSPFK